MIFNKAEYIDWKNAPVTKAFFSACKEREEELVERLVGSTENDSSFWLRGNINAYREIVDFRIDFEEENEENVEATTSQSSS